MNQYVVLESWEFVPMNAYGPYPMDEAFAVMNELHDERAEQGLEKVTFGMMLMQPREQKVEAGGAID